MGWGGRYYDSGIRQLGLLVVRGRQGYNMLFADPQGVALLQEAQHTVGETKDYSSNHHLDDLREQFASIFNIDLQIMCSKKFRFL